MAHETLEAAARCKSTHGQALVAFLLVWRSEAAHDRGALRRHTARAAPSQSHLCRKSCICCAGVAACGSAAVCRRRDQPPRLGKGKTRMNISHSQQRIREALSESPLLRGEAHVLRGEADVKPMSSPWASKVNEGEAHGLRTPPPPSTAAADLRTEQT